MIPILYAASVRPLSEEALYAKAWDAATPGRKEKTGRYHFERDRRLSLGAELLLRYALSEAGETMPDSFRLGEQGKPMLDDSTWNFNLSHSEEWVLCAVGEREVGCDVEKIGKANLSIARRFFCPGEYEYVAAGKDEGERSLRFARMWTLKESFLKNVGLGLKLPLNDFEITAGEIITVKQEIDDGTYRFRVFDDVPDYCCALCTAEDCTDSELRITDLRDLLL